MIRNHAYVALCIFVVFLSPAIYALESNLPSQEQISANSIPYKKNNVVTEHVLLKIGIVSALGVMVALTVTMALKKYWIKVPVLSDDKTNIHLRAAKKLTPKLMLMVASVDDTEYIILQSGERVSITLHRKNETDINSVES